MKIFRGGHSGQKDQQMQMTRVRGMLSVKAHGVRGKKSRNEV